MSLLKRVQDWLDEKFSEPFPPKLPPPPDDVILSFACWLLFCLMCAVGLGVLVKASPSPANVKSYSNDYAPAYIVDGGVPKPH